MEWESVKNIFLSVEQERFIIAGGSRNLLNLLKCWISHGDPTAATVDMDSVADTGHFVKTEKFYNYMKMLDYRYRRTVGASAVVKSSHHRSPACPLKRPLPSGSVIGYHPPFYFFPIKTSQSIAF